MWPSDSLETTAAVALPEIVLSFVLEGFLTLLIDACALELTFVEFHDISISMLILFSVSPARLRKGMLACSVRVLITHIATMHSINGVRSFVLFMFVMQWEGALRSNMFFIDHPIPASILNSQAFIMNARPRSTFWIEKQPELITPTTQSKLTLIVPVGCYTLVITYKFPLCSHGSIKINAILREIQRFFDSKLYSSPDNHSIRSTFATKLSWPDYKTNS